MIEAFESGAEPSATDRTPVHRGEIGAPPDRVWSALERAADQWGADWHPDGSVGAGTAGVGRLCLPVLAGIRLGLLEGDLSVRAAPAVSATPAVSTTPSVMARPGAEADRTELIFRPRTSFYKLNVPILVVLTLAALGALLVVVWPFVPRPEMAQVAPLGAVLALAGWFLVISRLENRGPSEFFELVAMEAVSEADSEPGESTDGEQAAVTGSE